MEVVRAGKKCSDMAGELQTEDHWHGVFTHGDGR